MATHYLEISEVEIAIGPHGYERNLYELLIARGAPVVMEANTREKGKIRYRALRPIGRRMITGADGKWVFWWED